MLVALAMESPVWLCPRATKGLRLKVSRATPAGPKTSRERSGLIVEMVTIRERAASLAFVWGLERLTEYVCHRYLVRLYGCPERVSYVFPFRQTVVVVQEASDVLQQVRQADPGRFGLLLEVRRPPKEAALPLAPKRSLRWRSNRWVGGARISGST